MKTTVDPVEPLDTESDAEYFARTQWLEFLARICRALDTGLIPIEARVSDDTGKAGVIARLDLRLGERTITDHFHSMVRVAGEIQATHRLLGVVEGHCVELARRTITGRK